MASSGEISDDEAKENEGATKSPDFSMDNITLKNFTLKAEEYLNSDDIKFCTDPKLKREKQRLEDLLNSYKKLIGKLESKFTSEEERKAEEERLRKVPEIYAVLHPELYKNLRDEEKSKLIEKFSQRRHFGPAERVIPRSCRTPVVLLNDKRQEEKERFIKILSSCPARFLNSDESPVKSLKVPRSKRHPTPLVCPSNQREVEKERLSKIFATSGAYLKKHLDHRTTPLSYRKQKPDNFEYTPTSAIKMVDGKDETPLSSKVAAAQPPAATLNQSRPIIQPRLLIPENIEAGERENASIAKEEEETLTDGVAGISLSNGGRQLASPVHSSTATQTDPFSPRERLLSDLHGVSDCFPGGTQRVQRDDMQDVRAKQAAYARALHEQIEEKRRLEAERRRRREEEERLAEERLRREEEMRQSLENDEERKKRDWMAQRQFQEEALRRKMLEFELEARELKKAEKKRHSDEGMGGEAPLRNPPPASRPVMPGHLRHSEEEPPSHVSFGPPVIGNGPTLPPNVSMRLSNNLSHHPPPHSLPREAPKASHLPAKVSRGPPHVSLGPPNSFVPSTPPSLKKFNGLEMAPLLDADRQNILTTNGFGLHSASPRVGMSVEREKYLERAEELLKAPMDCPIERSPSPPIPAVKTRHILSHVSRKPIDDKWEIGRDVRGEPIKKTTSQTGGWSGGGGSERILTQLGAFRRQLAEEHLKLESRLRRQEPSAAAAAAASS